MGRLMERYMAEYTEKVLPGLAARDLYAIRPEAWLTVKWESENDISPFSSEYGQRMRDLQEVDPELAAKISSWNKFMIG